MATNKSKKKKKPRIKITGGASVIEIIGQLHIRNLILQEQVNELQMKRRARPRNWANVR